MLLNKCLRPFLCPHNDLFMKMKRILTVVRIDFYIMFLCTFTFYLKKLIKSASRYSVDYSAVCGVHPPLQHCKQREPNVKIHRSPLSAEFWKHYVLGCGTQRRALPRHQSEEINIE